MQSVQTVRARSISEATAGRKPNSAWPAEGGNRSVHARDVRSGQTAGDSLGGGQRLPVSLRNPPLAEFLDRWLEVIRDRVRHSTTKTTRSALVASRRTSDRCLWLVSTRRDPSRLAVASTPWPHCYGVLQAHRVLCVSASQMTASRQRFIMRRWTQHDSQVGPPRLAVDGGWRP